MIWQTTVLVDRSIWTTGRRQLSKQSDNTRPSIGHWKWVRCGLVVKNCGSYLFSRTQTLSSIQTIVQQCPALAALQRDLEETNFQSAATIPVYSAFLTATASNNGHNRRSRTTSDCNANAEGGSSSPSAAGGVLQIKNGDSPSKNTIDSTA